MVKLSTDVLWKEEQMLIDAVAFGRVLGEKQNVGVGWLLLGSAKP